MATRSLTTKAGVFVTEGADLRFEALSAPTDAELDVLLRKTARRLIRLLRPPADVPEPDALDFLESAQHAALSAWQPARNDAPPKRKRHSAFVEGFSLHAGVHLHANETVGPISRVLPTRRFLPALIKRSRPARGRAMHRPRRCRARGDVRERLAGESGVLCHAPIHPH